MATPPRSTVIVAGVALAALCLGVALLRTGAHGGDTPARETSADADATPTTGIRLDVDAATGREVLGGTASAAVDAAIVAASAPQRWLYLTDEQIRVEVLAMATPAAGPVLADLTASDLAAAGELALSPGPVWWLVHPLATRVVSFTPTAAELEVWVVSVLSAVDVASPQAEWLTATVDLAWRDARWLVESIRDRPGPSPVLGPGDDPWDAAPFADALDGFVRLDGATVGEVGP